MVPNRFRLNVNKNGYQATIYIHQGDAASRVLQAWLFDDDGPIELGENYTARFVGVDGSGHTFYSDAEIVNDSIVFPLFEELSQVVGFVECQFDIYYDDARIHSPGFFIYVEKNVTADSNIEATSEFSALASAMSQADSYRLNWSNPTATAEKVAPDADPSVSISIGDGHVDFAFEIPQGETGEPAYLGDEPGCLVETTEAGVLRATRKLMVGDDAPEDTVGLRDGDLYVQVNPKQLVLYSSTASSTKRFIITVDDSGTITATEG